jgi:CheY-like chemotaxis protein
LAAKGLETVRLTEALSISPEDETARAALAKYLSDLRQSAGELGLMHLEVRVAEALTRLERESFGPASLVAVRALAWRYESLAAMPSQSGTHPVMSETEDTLGEPLLILGGDLEGEQPFAKASLRGRRILVAGNKAEARWFYVGVLREAGARVTEARDGLHALELAGDEAPDLILADIVMPGLDGLELCAAVRREPALDGVPVVLLSWRDDFLHRMREFQGGARGYQLDEGPARQILDRLSRVLEPLLRLEESLTSDREARGDLEELGVSALLRATRRLRPNASIVLQDPWSLFDLELHEGRIIEVTRTGIDGSVIHDAAAFPALVGMSSGRFVVAKMDARPAEEERESLDPWFAEATRRLSILMSTMAMHPDCHVELDRDVLGAYVRHSPVAIQRLIARLVAGEPLHALWESGAGSRPLVDAILVTLARQGAIREVTVPALASDRGPTAERSPRTSRELIESDIQQDSAPVADPLERENVRAQLGVAIHREPANQAPNWTYPIWRPNIGAGAGSGENDSGFGMEMQTTPRLLGLGFVTLLLVTVGFLIWHQAMPTVGPTGSPAAAPGPAQATATDEQVAPEAPLAVPSPSPGGLDLSVFAGSLRAGIDPSLDVAEEQGVLEIIGPSDVSVDVDGVDRGALPVTLVLDQGRHAVRYRFGAKWTYRFSYVKQGATRTSRLIAQPGGFVDAR